MAKIAYLTNKRIAHVFIQRSLTYAKIAYVWSSRLKDANIIYICTSTGHYRPLDIQIDVRYIGFADSQIEIGVYRICRQPDWERGVFGLQTARLWYVCIATADSQIENASEIIQVCMRDRVIHMMYASWAYCKTKLTWYPPALLSLYLDSLP